MREHFEVGVAGRQHWECGLRSLWALAGVCLVFFAFLFFSFFALSFRPPFLSLRSFLSFCLPFLVYLFLFCLFPFISLFLFIFSCLSLLVYLFLFIFSCLSFLVYLFLFISSCPLLCFLLSCFLSCFLSCHLLHGAAPMMKTPVQPRASTTGHPAHQGAQDSLRHPVVPKMSTPSYLDPRPGTGFGSCQHSEEQLANHLITLLFFSFACTFHYLFILFASFQHGWGRRVVRTRLCFVFVFLFSFLFLLQLVFPTHLSLVSLLSAQLR